MTREDLIDKCMNLFKDVNPNEIKDHAENGTVDNWCKIWRQEMFSTFKDLIDDLFEYINELEEAIEEYEEKK